MEEQLKWFLKSVKTYNNLIEGELLEISKGFWFSHTHFIDKYLKDFHDIIVYKGFWSGYELYKKPYYRFITDVDFLVNEIRYIELKKLFLDLGFKYYFQVRENSPAFVKRFEYVMNFYKNILHFEIHKSIFPPYYLDISNKKIFKRAIPWKFNLLTLPIEDQFIFSVLHFHKSSQKVLYWLWDISILYSKVDLKKVKEVCDYYSIDYERFSKILENIKLGNIFESKFFKKSIKSYVFYFLVKILHYLYRDYDSISNWDKRANE
ncbi:MAG: nucleotidyltransferase family protein [candidate division WOR-3 bacterium]|nr:nucleotidyltransferase family protein [candidate division WOR-3 bacterium]MCX7947693.1 nucleotidyltransferase family protein [candidate division WOR-3 bacterium]MDW8150570.1 nucleotidyltransferase family protein [candidate division WOR-3 bacterium]